MKKIAIVVMIAICLACVTAAYAAEGGSMETSVYFEVAAATPLRDGVKEITYDQFVRIRSSGEKYILLDVLPSDNYAKGHIDGAKSFPVDTINKETAVSMLTKDSNIVVYCGSFQCGASTDAAKKLMALGYNVLDYKGGLEEWQEKGNLLVLK